ncbi:hypothetical protein FRC02_000971 [Tulasnella sp. 418]|nr:hypothetical protein FRC02_000971 [Tulasnella sp. 418]
MTVYYTLTFFLLAAEVVTYGALVTPIPFTMKKKVFTFLSGSPLVAKLAYGLKIAFIFVAVLWVDAVQRVFRVTAQGDMTKQSGVAQAAQAESTHAAKKFYAQRNLYLTSFTLFLSVVVTRTYYIALDQVHMQDEYAKLKQSVVEKSRKDQTTQDSNPTIQDLRKQLEIKNKDIEALQKQLPKTNKKAD